MLREPKSERQAIAEILAIMRNVSVPFGAPCWRASEFTTPSTRTAEEPHRQAVLLRADDEAERGVGRPRQVRSLGRRSGLGNRPRRHDRHSPAISQPSLQKLDKVPF